MQKLAKTGALAAADATALIAAAETQNALTQVLRIAVDGTLDPVTASPGLKTLLVRADSATSFEDLEKRLATEQAQVRAIFERVMSLSTKCTGYYSSGRITIASTGHDRYTVSPLACVAFHPLGILRRDRHRLREAVDHHI